MGSRILSQLLTDRQLSNAGGFRRLAYTKPAISIGKEKKQQIKPALSDYGTALGFIQI